MEQILRTQDNLLKITTAKDEPVYQCDLLVVGGGINGAGVARDAAGRGLSVVMCEKDDWASATSSASSKLIHGGLRYLEHYEFRLVRESLIEREVLYNLAPHIIWPMSFVLPHNKYQRPKWMIRAGLFLYDHLGAGQRHGVFSKSHAVSLKDHPLDDQYKTGFVYTDCWVDDARLVMANVIDAHEKGAVTLSRTECRSLKADKETGLWTANLYHKKPGNTRGKTYKVQARCVVNAAGPWVSRFLKEAAPDIKTKNKTKMVKGSHIVVPRLYKGQHAYILQNDDERIVFVMPYEKYYTLIGTTDKKFNGDPANVKIHKDEKQYLCEVVSEYFTTDVSVEDIVWTYSGVRPLLDDGEANASKVTRDYKLDMIWHKKCPSLSIYGGKLTTYRKLSEQVMDELTEEVFEKLPKGWTDIGALPGGDFSPAANFDMYLNTLHREYHWLSKRLAYRYVHSYGSRVRVLLRNCHHIEDMGKELAPDLFEHEIDYLMDYEDAQTAEDVLWRRSKRGLHSDDDARLRVEKYMKKRAVKK